METLTQVLLIISNGLLVPVVAALFLLAAMAILQLGGFAAEAFVRQRRRGTLETLVRELKSTGGATVPIADLQNLFGLPGRAFRELYASSDYADKILDDLQLEAERLLVLLDLGIRLGPMLGLAGTLIPLGPALMALSTGDFTTLATNLVVAFTTTVLGLIIGGVCFAIHAVRRTWYVQDINDIEFISQRLPNNEEYSKARGGSTRPAARSGQPV